MCEGICSRDDRTVECFWKNQRTSAGRRFQKQGDYRKKYIICQFAVCLFNMLTYLFIYFNCDPPSIPPSITFFKPTQPVDYPVSADMTANRASLLVFTLLVCSLLVSKHGPCAPAVCGIPSMSTMETKKV